MEKIYSKIDDDKLLHIVVRLGDFKGRTEIVPENNFIQCAALKMPKERTYAEQIAQESWVVITGKVRCILYDTDNTVIATPILEAGDASFTLYGGHTYEILEEDTIVYEYKTGPYEGQQLDKEFIDA